MAESGFDSLSNAVRDIFMAGVGLAATGVDKSKEVIDDCGAGARTEQRAVPEG